MSKKYNMINKENDARIQCTEDYLTHWLARGFEVEEVVVHDGDEKDGEE